VLASLIIAAPVAAKPQSHRGKSSRASKLDRETKSRASRLLGTSRVIVTFEQGQERNGAQAVNRLGGRVKHNLPLVNGLAVELPNRTIKSRRGHGRRARGPFGLRLRRRRRRRRRHRLGHHALP
jgi:hypothetical protein